MKKLLEGIKYTLPALLLLLIAYIGEALVNLQEEMYLERELKCLEDKYLTTPCRDFLKSLNPEDPIRLRAKALRMYSP